MAEMGVEVCLRGVQKCAWGCVRHPYPTHTLWRGRSGGEWQAEKGPPFLSCGGRRDVAGERPSPFCEVRPVVRRIERLDTLRVEQAGDIAAAPHRRPGLAVQRDRVPVRCSPFVESVGERVHIGHPLTGPHDRDVQMFRHVVIVTRSPAHPGPAGGVSMDARIEWPGHTVSAGRVMRTILARRAGPRRRRRPARRGSRRPRGQTTTAGRRILASGVLELRTVRTWRGGIERLRQLEPCAPASLLLTKSG